jgi:hypothetical protein
MSNVPLSDVCVCGGADWHAMIDRVFWCRRCGSLRLIFEKQWRVPLDRAGDLPASATRMTLRSPRVEDRTEDRPAELSDDEKEGPPTDRGTPDAKKSVLP